MKLKQKKSLIEFVAKKNNVNEGLVDFLFTKALRKKVNKDSEFKKIAKDLDKVTKDAVDYFKEKEKQGETIPDSVKKVLGIK